MCQHQGCDVDKKKWKRKGRPMFFWMKMQMPRSKKRKGMFLSSKQGAHGAYKSYNLARCPIFVLYLSEEGILFENVL